MLRVKIPQSKLDKILFKLGMNPSSTALCEVGTNFRPEYDLNELLYHRTVGYFKNCNITQLKPGFRPLIMKMSRRLSKNEREEFLKSVTKLRVGAGLFFVLNGSKIEVFYIIAGQHKSDETACLSVPGAGMEQILMNPLFEYNEKLRSKESDTFSLDKSIKKRAGLSEDQGRLRYSRLAGAIGNGDVERGFQLLLKASKLKIVVVGAGRAGSWLSFRLAQSGVGVEAGHIIADPDIVEIPNFDGLIPAQAIGWPKAEAVASTISAMTLISKPRAINCSLNSKEVVDAIRTSDVVFSAVDENNARLGTAVLASRYHLLHIDLCGGVAWTGNNQVDTGGEIRVFIPGTPGCLSCMGGENSWGEAMDLLSLSPEEERERRVKHNWNEQRAGSSPDILFPIIGEALQNFWSILRGKLKESRWLHYHKDRKELPIWTDWSNQRKWRECRICGDQAGIGDMPK